MGYAIATLVALQEDIAKAGSILIIGAGPVGIEVAGVSDACLPSCVRPHPGVFDFYS